MIKKESIYTETNIGCKDFQSYKLVFFKYLEGLFNLRKDKVTRDH